MPDRPFDNHPEGPSANALPRYHKRAFAHNYHAPFIYHIILKKRVECENFGIVRGDARIAPGLQGSARIEESKLGSIISRAVIGLQFQFPILQIYQFRVMPDHVHILLRVKEWTDSHLDNYIDRLKSNIAATYSKAVGRSISPAEIFQPGYCDKPLLRRRNLDVLFRYIRENPHRLAMRQQFPQFFRRIRKLKIGEKYYEAYGNLFLIRNPDKEAVKVSRSFTPEEKTEKRSAWLAAAARGAILVSPFISPAEKEIRAAAEALGARIILITNEAFPERYKPSARDFALCCQGRLLIITLSQPADAPLTRLLCNQMNTLAAEISQ